MIGRGASERNGGFAETVAKVVVDEASLVRRIDAGDRRAFEELYRLYHPRLARFLLQNVRRRDLVEEVLNDTLMTLWRKPQSFRGASKLSTWLFSIAYRKALKARTRFDVPLEDKGGDRRPSSDPTPEHDLGRRQAQVLLQQAMAQLSPDHRAVVDLTYFHDFGYREIAEIMSCPVDTVKTRMFYARRKLRDAFPGDLEDWL